MVKADNISFREDNAIMDSIISAVKKCKFETEVIICSTCMSVPYVSKNFIVFVYCKLE